MNNDKKVVYTTLDNQEFNLGQYGSDSTVPLLNIDNDTNIDLSSGFDIITQETNNIFKINDFNLVILDSHTPVKESNISVYGNGLNSSNINIVYFTDTGSLSYFINDETPNAYSEHITSDNINNYNRLNAVGTNYNIQTFDRNIKTDITINKEDYKDGNSFIFDIDKNGILDGDININNITKPGIFNQYHFNKSVTTPFDFTFQILHQHNIILIIGYSH
jgi:hypothetical protein